MRTRHGHHIPHTVHDGTPPPENRARCGGVKYCTDCKQDARLYGERSEKGPTVPRYQSKVTLVEAEEVTRDTVDRVARWCGGRVIEEQDAQDTSKTFVGINLPTLHGMARASEGDYVVKGAAGDFWPVQRDIFQSKYEQPDG